MHTATDNGEHTLCFVLLEGKANSCSGLCYTVPLGR